MGDDVTMMGAHVTGRDHGETGSQRATGVRCTVL
jgi:hypothetical protein